MPRATLLLITLTIVFASQKAPAQNSIEGRWDPGFGDTDFGGQGLASDVRALAHDPSTGAVYVGGSFLQRIDNVPHYVLKWTGSEWEALGSGIQNTVFALDVDDSGDVYAGGSFRTAGGDTVNNVAMWNGATWEPLGRGVVGGRVEAIRADPNSNDVYIGGSFDAVIQSDGSLVESALVAKWNGATWEALGRGGVGLVIDDIEIDPLTGDVLVGGRLWDGMLNPDSTKVTVESIASWNGAEWKAVDDGSLNSVHVMRFDREGNLYVGHNDNGGIAIWDRESWSVPSGGGIVSSPHQVYALEVRNDRIYVAGDFDEVTQPDGSILPVRSAAVWEPSTGRWFTLGAGLEATNGPNGWAMTAREQDVWIGGRFEDAGARPSFRVARWSEEPPPFPETRVTFRADYRAAMRKGLLSNVRTDRTANFHPIVDVFTGSGAAGYFLYDLDGDSIWSVQVPQRKDEMIEYAYSIDWNGSGYDDNQWGDWIRELNGRDGARAKQLTDASVHTLPVVSFDNRRLLSVDPDYTYRIARLFQTERPRAEIFQRVSADADVRIDIARVSPNSVISVRWYTKDPGGAAPQGILNRSENSYWVIDVAPLASDYEATVEFNYDPIPGISDDADLRLLRRADATRPWSVVAADVDVNERVVRLSNVTDVTGEWTLGSVSSGNPLTSDPPQAARGPSPSDGDLNAPIRPTFSWNPVPGAQRYDFYLWEEGEARPTNPWRGNLSEPEYRDNQDLIFGATYNWFVVASNINGETEGPVWTFRVGSVPDLVVSQLAAPAGATSGQLIEVEWTVTNDGDGGTNAPVWFDEVFVSESGVFDRTTATSVGRFENVSFLDPGESYANTQTVTIPRQAQGDQFVHVVADSPNRRGDLLDEAEEDNNGAVSPLSIDLSPFADLRVTSVVVPTNVFSGDSIDVQWTVENAGNGRTSSSSWRDVLFLSGDDFFDFNFSPADSVVRVAEDFLGLAEHQGALEPGESYVGRTRIKLPNEFIGSAYVFVYADRRGAQKQAIGGDVFEFNVELNNWAGDSLRSTLTPPPDLVVTEVIGPSSAQSGDVVEVSWSVLNQGPGATRSQSHVDEVFFSQEPEFDPDNAVLIGSLRHRGILQVDEGYSTSREVRVPDGVDGPAYFHVEADGLTDVFEHTFEDNNTGNSSVASEITRAPYPDLQIVSVIVAPTSTVAGSEVAVTYTIENNGNRVTGRRWNDSLYVSSTPEWDPGEAVPVAAFENGAALEPGAARNQTLVATLPARMDGTLYVYAKADAARRVFEYPDEDGNEGRSSEIVVGPYPPVDLVLDFGVTPSSVESGQVLPISLTVTNAGSGATLSSDWFDEIYLSTNDTLERAADRSLVQLEHDGVVAGGASYTYELDLNIPEDIIGEVFLLAAVDSEGDVAEDEEENNLTIRPVTVNLTPPADLRVTDVSAPDAITGGQSLTVEWTVENEGVGATRSVAETGGWYDYVYLSEDRVLDRRDALLGIRERQAGLDGGASYTASLRGVVPSWASGAYNIVVQTDQRDDVYEHTAEGDNLTFKRVNLTLPPPTDIVVALIEVPEGAVPGEEMSISWTVRNDGANPARGTMRDALFLSEDDEWDLSDLILGTHEREIDIPPGAVLKTTSKVDVGLARRLSAQGEVTEVVPGLDPGDYFVLVRADVANAIRETDDENNTSSSSTTVAVDFATLTPGVAAIDSHATGEARYYRLTVGEGEDVRLSVVAGTGDSSTELYASFGKVPTVGAEADFSAAEPFQSNQKLVIPSTADGTYFVLVFARGVPNESGMDEVTVLAETLGFGVENITPNFGGQGQVTTSVNGAGFRDDDTFLLRDDQGEVVAGSRIEEGNSTEATIRFQLQSAALGGYDFVVQRAGAGEETVLSDAFEVQEATAQTVVAQELVPEAFRDGGRAEFFYRYVNTGNIDIDYLEAQFQILETPDIRVETSTGLLTSSDIFPAPDTVASVDFVLSPDSVYLLPLLARDLPPGRSVHATFITETAQPESYQFSHSVQAVTTEEYLANTIEDLLEERDFILENSTVLGPETVQRANDEDGWVEDNLRMFAEAGLFDSEDIAGVGTSGSVLKGLAAAGSEVPYNGKTGVGSGFFAQQEFYRITDGSPNEETPEEICARGRKRAITKTCSNPHKACDCVRDIKTRCFPFFDIERSKEFEKECKESFDACEKQMKDQRKNDSSAPVSPPGCKCRPNIKSCDPNDIIGPDGYGDEQWVGISQTLPYSIRFENDPERALAPAQVVRINHPLDEDVDARSFRLGDFGFGSFIFSPPDNRAHYKTRLDVVDSLGVLVDVTAGIDVLANEAFWVFSSVDPATGDLPKNDPFAGFLPINDDRGSGEGFVSYSIQPQESGVTGDLIDAQARIFFDLNAPIDTPPVSNTLDADYPVSRVTVLPGKQDSTVFQLDWSGEDIGAGIATYSVYVSRDEGPFELYADGLEETSLLFVGEENVPYRFFVIARDHVANAEPLKSEGEAGTTVPIEDLYDASLPKTFALYSNYPNPFNPSTSIEYDLPQAVDVHLAVYDLLGRRVTTLVETDQTAGRYRVVWDATTYASGTYFYRLEAGDFSKTVKMILVK